MQSDRSVLLGMLGSEAVLLGTDALNQSLWYVSTLFHDMRCEG